METQQSCVVKGLYGQSHCDYSSSSNSDTYYDSQSESFKDAYWRRA